MIKMNNKLWESMQKTHNKPVEIPLTNNMPALHSIFHNNHMLHSNL